jgi:transcriptional regulator with XRE-family HTH domain
LSLSDNLKILRNNLGLTQEQVSKDLKINRATYAHYETGRREPDVEMLKLLAKYYNVATDDLLDNDISSNGTESIFSKRLKELRKNHMTTQEELAKYLGVGRPTIAGYETKGKQPSFEILDKIADFFNVSIDYLLGRSNIERPEGMRLMDSPDKNYTDNEIVNEIEKLSLESQEDLKKLIELYKIRDMQKRNAEDNDELAALD